MMQSEKAVTRTGGREATETYIPGDVALTVGTSNDLVAPQGWQWVRLTDVARLESGHTPSRRHPEYWDGEISWLGLRDAKANHGGVINESTQHITQLGLDNSSARLLPPGTVCLSRTASVGYVVVLGCEMATSQDFVNWVCSDKLLPEFLQYLLLAEKRALLMFGAGAVHKTIYFPLVKAFHICLPSRTEQQRIVAILDDSFAGIATATANAEKNLQNARELYQRALRNCFDQGKQLKLWSHIELSDRQCPEDRPRKMRAEVGSTSTKGRAATDRLIEGMYSLSVGMPTIEPRAGWKWAPLSELARLESGHTPSRKHPEYWNGDVPWIGIKDAKLHHGGVIDETQQMTNEAGINNSAARLLPKGTVCLSRTASVGYVVVTGREMVTSQDFVNWVCGQELEPHYLKYLFLAEGKDLLKYASGAVHQTIYFPEVKAFHICHPSIGEQRQVVEYLDDLRDKARRLEVVLKRKLSLLSELKQSILNRAFAGELH